MSCFSIVFIRFRQTIPQPRFTFLLEEMRCNHLSSCRYNVTLKYLCVCLWLIMWHVFYYSFGEYKFIFCLVRLLITIQQVFHKDQWLSLLCCKLQVSLSLLDYEKNMSDEGLCIFKCRCFARRKLLQYIICLTWLLHNVMTAVKKSGC